ncbi:putative membrane protein [Bacillus clarus]|uniref:Putative membrane protein n=1 Tax=Bacillus clarus TaxID=2338372 RepID=A0A090YT20_9BACI|nr:putative membrane protein [Bacillus clarus]
MKILMVLNVLNYLNNFVFMYVNGFMVLEGPTAMWFVSPLLFLTLTSFILATDYKIEYQIFKKEALFDYIIRVIAAVIAFFNYKFEFFSFEYILRFTLVLLLFIASIVLEYGMLRKVKSNVGTIEKNTEDVVTEEEKQNIRKMGKAVRLGVTSFFLVTAGAMNVTVVANLHMYYIAISIGVFIVFLRMNYTKVKLLYLDKNLKKRIYIRDSLYACLGFIFNVFIAIGIFSFGEGEQTLGILIGCLSLYPTIRTNRKIALRHKHIVEVMGDQFSYYYTLKD